MELIRRFRIGCWHLMNEYNGIVNTIWIFHIFEHKNDTMVGQNLWFEIWFEFLQFDHKDFPNHDVFTIDPIDPICIYFLILRSRSQNKIKTRSQNSWTELHHKHFQYLQITDCDKSRFVIYFSLQLNFVFSSIPTWP